MKVIAKISIKIAALVIIGAAITACTQQASKSQRQSSIETKSDTSTLEKDKNKASIKGNISHNTWEGDAATSVTFDAFPTTINEWKSIQQKLGCEPQGAVALQVMAFELYRNNRTDGEEALKLNNTSTNYTCTVERLKEIMGKDQYYARPYIAWAMLEGATPENGYKADPPFTINMKVDPNKKYQNSQMLHGTVIYLLIDSKGWDTNWRGVEVVKPEGSDYYVVSNCPAIYTQCKEAK